MLIIAVIKDQSIKYDTIGRHYFLYNGARWERVGLKFISKVVGLPAIEVASAIKREREKRETRVQDTFDYKRVWDTVACLASLVRIYTEKAQFDTECAKLKKVYKDKLVYFKSKFWYLGRRLGFTDDHIIKNLDYADAYYCKAQTE